VRDPYEILGLSRAADDGEIHAAYRRLAKRYHPDLHPDDSTAEARFKEIAAAYERLSDREERARYDHEHPAAGSDDAGYSAERGYDSARSEPVARSLRRAREWGPGNLLLIAFGLWALLSYGNGLLRGYSTALDGTIDNSTSMTAPLVHTLFFRGDLRAGRYTNVYTIRRADGEAQTFIAGRPAAS